MQSRFGTGNRFTSAYLDYFEEAQGVTLETEEDYRRLTDTQRMWFEYALSTNGRGEDLMAVIERHRPLKGVRFLDIGCGFGGFLVAAARHGAASCTGIEADPARAGFSRENVADSGFDIAVHDLDALTPGIEDRLGTFDVITCNDVIEHVHSAQDLLVNVARLLRPGGIACLEIPNGECIEFVAHDGHFGLFGITLLEREQARAYHFERFHCVYDVGDYWPLEDLYRFFEHAGLRAELIPSLYHPTRPVAVLDEQLRLLESARVADPRFDGPYEAYRARIERDRVSLDEETFRNRYLRNFWTFLASPLVSGS